MGRVHEQQHPGPHPQLLAWVLREGVFVSTWNDEWGMQHCYWPLWQPPDTPIDPQLLKKKCKHCHNTLLKLFWTKKYALVKLILIFSFVRKIIDLWVKVCCFLCDMSNFEVCRGSNGFAMWRGVAGCPPLTWAYLPCKARLAALHGEKHVTAMGANLLFDH